MAQCLKVILVVSAVAGCFTMSAQPIVTTGKATTLDKCTVRFDLTATLPESAHLPASGIVQIGQSAKRGASSSYWASAGNSSVTYVNRSGQVTFSVTVTRSSDKNWALPFDAVDQLSHQVFQVELGKGWSQLDAITGCPGPKVAVPISAEAGPVDP